MYSRLILFLIVVIQVSSLLASCPFDSDFYEVVKRNLQASRYRYVYDEDVQEYLKNKRWMLEYEFGCMSNEEFKEECIFSERFIDYVISLPRKELLDFPVLELQRAYMLEHMLKHHYPLPKSIHKEISDNRKKISNIHMLLTSFLSTYSGYVWDMYPEYVKWCGHNHPDIKTIYITKRGYEESVCMEDIISGVQTLYQYINGN